MTPDQIASVESTFRKIGPITQATGVDFYNRLFERDPTTRSLFDVDMGLQAVKLMQVLAFVVSNLHAPETLLPMIRDLGRRHVAYGVTEAHYDSVIAALLDTLAHALGPVWTPDVAAAWASAFATIASEMKSAARSAAAG